MQTCPLNARRQALQLASVNFIASAKYAYFRERRANVINPVIERSSKHEGSGTIAGVLVLSEVVPLATGSPEGVEVSPPGPSRFSARIKSSDSEMSSLEFGSVSVVATGHFQRLLESVMKCVLVAIDVSL